MINFIKKTLFYENPKIIHMIKNEYNLCKKEKTENVIIKNNLVNIRKRKKKIRQLWDLNPRGLPH